MSVKLWGPIRLKFAKFTASFGYYVSKPKGGHDTKWGLPWSTSLDEITPAFSLRGRLLSKHRQDELDKLNLAIPTNFTLAHIKKELSKITKRGAEPRINAVLSLSETERLAWEKYLTDLLTALRIEMLASFAHNKMNKSEFSKRRREHMQGKKDTTK